MSLKRMKFVEDIPIYSDDYEIESILPNLSQVITPINLEDRAILGEKIKYITHEQEVFLIVIHFKLVYCTNFATFILIIIIVPKLF